MFRITLGTLSIPGWRRNPLPPSGCVAAPGDGTFFGTCLLQDGFTPMASATVNFCRPGVCYTTLADSNGVFITVPQISAGTYTIKFGSIAADESGTSGPHIMLPSDFVNVGTLVADTSPFGNISCT